MTITLDPTGGNSGNTDTGLAARAVTTRFKLVADTSPWLAANPDLIAAMAQDPSIDNTTLATRSAAVAGMMNMDALHKRLQDLDAPTQRALFGQLTSTQQQALGSMGYSAPTRNPSHSGVSGHVDDAFGDLGGFVGDVIGGVGSAVKGVAGGAMDVLNVIGSEPAHLYRTIRTLDVDQQLLAWGGALLAGVGAAAGIAASPFTGGLSLGLTAGLIGGGALLGATATTAITSPTDWWDSYRSTYDGEKTFMAGAQRRANELLGNNSTIVNLAKDIAYDGGIGELAKDFAGTADASDRNVMLGSVQRVVDKMLDRNDPRYKDTLSKVATIAQTDEFQQAVATLQNGKISFGRDIANGLGIDPGSKLYNLTSGAADGIWLITMDPTMMAGAFGEINKVRRFTVPILDPEETYQFVKRLSDTNGAVQRAHTMMAQAVETGDFGVIKRTMPESQSMWDTLLNHRDVWREANPGEVYDRGALLDFFHSSAGHTSLMEGKATVKGQSSVMLANTSRRSAEWAKFKDWAHTTINIADSNNSSHTMLKAIEDLDPEAMSAARELRVTQEGASPLAKLGESGIEFRWDSTPQLSNRYRNTKAVVDFIDRMPVLGTLERQAGALLGTMTNMIPETNMITLGGSHAAEQVDKFVDLGRVAGMRGDTRELWRSFILNQNNPALRAAAIESYIGTMLEVSGAGVTNAGQEMAQRFIEKSHQVFSLGGSDILTIAGRERRVGVLPMGDQAYALAMPDLKELRQAVQKGAFMKYVFNAGDTQILDSAMSKIWKPAVLLRIGFIPRAAGEELLAHFAREGVSAYIASFGERAVAQGQLSDRTKTLDLLRTVDPKAFVSKDLLADMENWHSLAHLRPLESMFARSKWTRPAANLIDTYSSFLRNGLEHGILPESVIGSIPEGMRNAVLGKDRSLRRLMLTGVEPEVQRAAIAFEGGFAKSLLDTVSAKTHGILDVGTHGRDLVTVPVRDPITGDLKNVPMVKQRGVYHYLSPQDPLYTNGMHETVRHLTNQDAIVGKSLGSILPRIRPKGISEAAAEELHAGFTAITDPAMHNVMRLALDGRNLEADHIDALINKLRYQLPDAQIKELRMWLPSGGGSPAKVIEAMRHVRDDKYVDDALAFLDKLNGLTESQRGWAAHFLENRPTLVDDTQKYWLTPTQAKQQLHDMIRAGQLSPELQEYLRGSMHNLMSPDGTQVAKILDQPRTYFPAMHPDNASKLAAGIARDPAVQAAAATGTGDVADAVRTVLKERYRTMPNLMWKSDESFAQADAWIDQFVARHFDGSTEKLSDYVRTAAAGVPDRNVVLTGDFALQDPRVATDLTATLQSFVGSKGTANASGAAFMEVGRGKARRYIDNPLLVNGRAELVPAGSQMIVTPNGSVVHGISLEDSADGWATVIQERINQVLREDVQTALTAKRTVPYLENKPIVHAVDTSPITIPDNIPSHARDEHFYGEDRVLAGQQVEEPLKRSPEVQAKLDEAQARALELDQKRYSDTVMANRQAETAAKNKEEERLAKLRPPEFDHANAPEGALYRKVSDGQRTMRYEPVRPDEVLSRNAEYFSDAKGKNPVAWGDTNHMITGQVKHEDGWLFDQAGPALRDFFDSVANNGFRTQDGRRIYHYGLDNVGRSTGHLPNLIFSQALTMPAKETALSKVTQFGFNKVISPSIDAIARTPMAYHYFTRAFIENSKAARWMIDKELVDEAIPKLFSRSYNTELLGKTRRGELADAARTNAKYFDHDISAMSDSEVMAYLSQLSGPDLQQVTQRVLTAGPGRNHDAMVAMLDVKRTSRNAFKHGVDGIDHNLEFTRDMLDDLSKAINHDTWATAREMPHVQAMLSQRPGLDQAMERGGFDLLKQAHNNIAHVDQRILEASQERAIVNTVPFLDSHQIKSQFAEYGKSMMPFWYAEENFFKRWGRTLLLNPDAMRKGQLTYMGMKNVGIVKTDANGQDWFVYPGSQVLTDVLSKVPFLGAVPFDAGFATRTSQLLPGFSENVGTPSFAPFVTFPLAVASQIFPELGSLQSAVIGKQNVNRGIVRQFVPTQFQNFYDAATADDTNKSFASAMMSSAQYLEAHGQGLKPDATTDDLNDYIDNLRSSARTIMIARAITGFVSPGSPTMKIEDDKASFLRKEYLDLIRYQGVEDGTGAFIAAHAADGPSALANPLAYAVGQSESKSGAPLPATAEAVAFYRNNADWIDSNPLAGAWLLPPERGAGGSKASIDAYNQQAIDGLRAQRSPTEFVRAMRFKTGASEYFRELDNYNLLVKQANLANDRTARNNADQAWLQYSTGFKATHPVFAEELANGDGKTRRQNTIAQLRTVIEDPDAPKPWHFDRIKEVVETFTAYQAQLADLSQSRSASALRSVDALKARYADLMDRYIYDHPEVESLWTSVLKPEASLG